MKKTASLLIMLLLCLCLSVTASAEGENFKVYYVDADSQPCTVVPAETLHFTVTAEGIDPARMIAVADTAAAGSVTTVPITLPTYQSAGEYAYTITQSAGTASGVTYDSGSIVFKVLVGYDTDDQLKILATGMGNNGETKKDSFTNTCSYGTLSISNRVRGTDADRDTLFSITVSFEAPEQEEIPDVITYTVTAADGTETTGTVTGGSGGSGRTKSVTLTMKHGSTATFSNIPAGVSYSVSQQSIDGFGTPQITPPSGSITAGQTASTTVQNYASHTIGSGIHFRNTGTIIVFAAAVIGLLALLFGKRHSRP